MSYSLNTVMTAKGDGRIFNAFVCPDVSDLPEEDAIALLEEKAKELSKIFPGKIVELMQNKPTRVVHSQWKQGWVVVNEEEVAGE